MPSGLTDRAENEVVTFTITCTMKRRWANQFWGMLTHMQRLGSWGSSRDVTFMADGDGDFRPKFDLSGTDLVAAEPLKTSPSGNTYFDAG
jgi:hypothetical protein